MPIEFLAVYSSSAAVTVVEHCGDVLQSHAVILYRILWVNVLIVRKMNINHVLIVLNSACFGDK